MAKTPGKLGKPGSIKIFVSLGLIVTILGIGIGDSKPRFRRRAGGK